MEAVEAVSEILSRVARGGTSVEPAFELVAEGLSARLDTARPATVRGYVPSSDPAATAAAVTAVETALAHLSAFGLRPIGELTTREVHEDDWATAWKRHFPVLRLGRRLVVRPTWRRHRPVRDEAVVTLDPGMAFGTGLHPTTRLSLIALERVADSGDANALGRVLDVGCGSGILSIAAAQLGAGRVLGLDIDPIAVESTVSNVRRNHLSRRIRARLGSLPSRQPPFDLVLANLVASVIIDLAGELAAELRPGGRLIAAGIFVDREADVQAAFEAASLRVEGRDVEGDWVALTAVRPG
ncbi:MAG: 50S ribosomal protein L11 methyltransferase [Chloroflexi bacterium]|nr:50S ribosomal protein L11 methyltransferase [Chloroflexota bacterium]